MAKRTQPIVAATLPPERAVVVLSKQKQKAAELLDRPHLDYADYHSWAMTTREFLINSFASPSTNVTRFDDVDRPPPIVVSSPRDSFNHTSEPTTDHWKGFIRGKLVVVESCIDQLEAFLPPQPVPADTRAVSVGRNVFLVHGRNDGVRESVARFLEKLSLPVTILSEQSNRGRTVIEKFEDHAAEVGFAVVLLTGDDKGGLSTDPADSYRLRARQNVILELGYFLAKLGRGRVCALYEQGVEIPSDYSGVLFVELDSNRRWHVELARELKATGFVVDMNKAFD